MYDKLPYNFNELAVIDYGNGVMRFLLEDGNQDIAREDILSMNKILAEERSKNKSFPAFKIEPDSIRFNPISNLQEHLENDDYSCFIFNPTSPTGKATKYPLTIEFKTLSQDESYKVSLGKGTNIFGSISYLANGSIGKCNLVCWKGHNMWNIKKAL
jgi:hypothetical protein